MKPPRGQRREIALDRRLRPPLELRQAAAPVGDLDRRLGAGLLGVVEPLRSAVGPPAHDVGRGHEQRRAREESAPVAPLTQRPVDLERRVLVAGAPLDPQRREQGRVGPAAAGLGQVGEAVALGRGVPVARELVAAPLLVQRARLELGLRGGGRQAAEVGGGDQVVLLPEIGPRQRVEVVALVGRRRAAGRRLQAAAEIGDRQLEEAIAMEHPADEQRRLGGGRQRLGEAGQPLGGAARRLVVLVLLDEPQQPRRRAVAVALPQGAVGAGELQPPPPRGGQRPHLELAEQPAVAAGLEGADQPVGRRVGQRRRRAGGQEAREQARRHLGVAAGEPVAGEPEAAVRPQLRSCVEGSGEGVVGLFDPPPALEQIAAQVVEAELGGALGLLLEALLDRRQGVVETAGEQELGERRPRVGRAGSGEEDEGRDHPGGHPMVRPPRR